MARRIHELDALRGLALAGIVEFNIVQMTGFPRPEGPAGDHPGAYVWEALFIQRPFPIFSFLFGISFALFLRTAGNRTDRPRLVLLRRLLWLGVFAALHTLLQPGEVLKFYALFGIVVLLPASYLSRRWVLGLGIVLTVAAGLTFNGLFIIPGLFLLGLATARYGIPDTLDRRTRQLWIAFAGAVPAAAVLLWLQWRAGVGHIANYRILPAGTVCAFLVTVAFLLIMRTPVRRPIDTVLGPMGRMALTNYVLASVLILIADRILDLGGATGFAPIVWTGLTIGMVQAALSVVWLRRFRYGPLEWLWRCLTWWQLVPIRAEASERAGAR
ncbi:DUF418 domain-containing protein [Paractinoplanes maris]|uniref:DUF418 domain-containing protein n=1 Tax=Paractinoplanes maris TaxID=1734446 RepID=UPI00202264CC|nr:DUF418 domain-containing protein [Actinoplanes maris]